MSLNGPGSDAVFIWSTGDIRRVKARRRGTLGASQPAPADVQPGPESRRYPRLDLAMPILYRVLGEGSAPVPPSIRPFLLAETKDVSPLGLCLSLETPLGADVVVSLTFHVVERREKFEGLGRVVWCRPAEDGIHHLVGLQFVVVSGRRFREKRHARMEELIREM